MRFYDYYRYTGANGYGQPQLSEDIQGFLKMAIVLTTQSTQDNINYKDAQYLGITMDNAINDTFVIAYGDKKLKVLYINKQGRYNQVFLKEI